MATSRIEIAARTTAPRVGLDFEGVSPASLVAGETAQGRLQLGGDSPARLRAAGPFLERTGDWVFVLAKDGEE